MLWNFILWGIGEVADDEMFMPHQDGISWEDDWDNLKHSRLIQEYSGVYVERNLEYTYAKAFADYLFDQFSTYLPESQNSLFTQQFPYRKSFYKNDNLRNDLQAENLSSSAGWEEIPSSEAIPIAIPISADEISENGKSGNTNDGSGAGACSANISNETNNGGASVQNEHQNRKQIFNKALQIVSDNDIMSLKQELMTKIRNTSGCFVGHFMVEFPIAKNSLPFFVESEKKIADLMMRDFAEWCRTVNSLEEKSHEDFSVQIKGNTVVVNNPSRLLMQKYALNEHYHIFDDMNDVEPNEKQNSKEKQNSTTNMDTENGTKTCLMNVVSGEESNINQISQPVGHYVGTTVGIFRDHVAADNGSAIHLTTVKSDGANWNSNKAIVGGSRVIGISDYEGIIHSKGPGIIGIKDAYNPKLNQIESLHLIIPEMHYMQKPNRFHSDRRILSLNRLRDSGMPFRQKNWKGRDVLECERTGYKIICSDTQGIGGIRTFHLDARKLWNQPGVQQIFKLVAEGKISPMVRIKYEPSFSIEPLEILQNQDFRNAQVQGMKQ